MSDADLIAAIVRTWRSLDPTDEIGRATEAMRMTRDHDVLTAKETREASTERGREAPGGAPPRKRN